MSLYRKITETALIKQGPGALIGAIINSHSSGTLKLIDGLSNGAAATTDLTSSGAMVPADYATNTLTSNGTNVSEGATVTIGANVYTFKEVPLLANDVLIGADAEASLSNLKKRLNLTGTRGVTYGMDAVEDPNVIGGTLTSTTLKVWARTIGTTPNTLATTETSATLSWADSTLGGGTGTSDPGVTTAGATFTLDNVTYMAVVRLAESIGLPSVANQILWVTSEAVFLDNVKSAVNRTGTPGTDYSTATEIHPTVEATTNTNTVQTFVAKKIGTGGNSIVTTETMANYAFTGATMASGTLTDGRVLCNTITFSAVATTGERFIPFGKIDFVTGLLAVIGGTADITLVYE